MEAAAMNERERCESIATEVGRELERFGLHAVPQPAAEKTDTRGWEAKASSWRGNTGPHVYVWFDRALGDEPEFSFGFWSRQEAPVRYLIDLVSKQYAEIASADWEPIQDDMYRYTETALAKLERHNYLAVEIYAHDDGAYFGISQRGLRVGTRRSFEGSSISV
jgi:hypothetical protein